MTTNEQPGRLDPPVFADVLAARVRIEPWIHCTPIMTSEYLDELAGASLLFKCENLQKAGAFKVRGACNAVFGLPDARATPGVATHSSGNHALSLSYAAACRGIGATVVMPRDAPEAKKAAVQSYGGVILECEPSVKAREAMLRDLIDRTDADFVHPYNDPRVIAGQATCALELHEDAGELDAIVAPIGGGGMISGTCLSMNEVSPHTLVYAAEPEQADDAYRSLRAGAILEVDAPQTIADGLRTSLAPLTWYFVSNHVSEVLLATEQEIVDAMFLIWQRMKIVVEPSSAVALAVILKNRGTFAGKRVGVILTGGNVDLDNLPWAQD